MANELATIDDFMAMRKSRNLSIDDFMKTRKPSAASLAPVMNGTRKLNAPTNTAALPNGASLNAMVRYPAMAGSAVKDAIKPAYDAMKNTPSMVTAGVPFGEAAARKVIPPIVKYGFDIPSAAVRSAVMGRGYAYGAANPEKIPKFEEIASNPKIQKILAGNNKPLGEGIQEAARGFDTLTNPAELLSFVPFDPAIKAVSKIPNAAKSVAKTIDRFGSYLGEAEAARTFKKMGGLEGIQSKMDDLTVKIMNPPKADLTPFEEEMITNPQVREASMAIPQAQNYRDVLKKLREKSINAQRIKRAEIAKENFAFDDAYIKKVEKDLAEKYQGGDITKSDFESAMRAVSDERDFVSKQTGFDRLQADRRKSVLDKRAEKIYKQAAKGVYNPEQTGEYPKTVAKLAGELRKRVAGGNQIIERSNEIYGNLLKPRKWAAGQSVLARKADKAASKFDLPGMIMSFATGRWKHIPEAFARGTARSALAAQESLLNRTRELSKLKRLYDRFGPKEPLNRGIDDAMTAAYEVLPETGRLTGTKGLLPAPKVPITTAIPNPEFGGTKLLRAPYYLEQSPITFGESQLVGGKKSMLKKMGIDPYSGKMKYGKPKTSLQAALERLKTKE